MTDSALSILGLAPFLRMNIANTDLKPVAVAMLDEALKQPDNANLWMNLSTIMHCLGQRDLGLTMQRQALELQRIYHLAASSQPASMRLLMLVVPGDLSANTPMDCLLENSDIDLVLYYITPGETLALPLPLHDVLMVAMSESDDNQEVLQYLEQALASWQKPVINAPQHIHCVGRAAASELLQNVPGLLMPPTLRGSRTALQSIATGASELIDVFDECDFPIIVRPLKSHGGHGLAKIETIQDLSHYLKQMKENEFFVSRFIDYSDSDGFFRKVRIALIGGLPYACHMAVSSHWMIHYVNAGMYEEASKRQEELAFFSNFDDFVRRHQVALTAIAIRTQLDYVCIDCAQTRSGELLVFEIDHAMVVHAMDTEEQFPYKQIYMKKVKDAFRNELLRVCGHSV